MVVVMEMVVKMMMMVIEMEMVLVVVVMSSKHMCLQPTESSVKSLRSPGSLRGPVHPVSGFLR